MSESIDESISALMDDEATELDVRRVLKAAEQSPHAADRLRRYQLARTVLNENQTTLLDIDLRAGISAALLDDDHQELDEQRSTGAGKSWLRPVVGLAVAASVAALVVVSSPLLNGINSPAGSEIVQADPATSTNALAQNLPFQSETGPAVVGRDAQPLDYRLAVAEREAKRAVLQQRVNAYMRIHAQHASMNGSQGALPLVRVADYRQ